MLSMENSSPDARAYLAKHQVQEILQAAIAETLKTKPADPLAAIAEKIKSTSYTFLTIQPTFTIKDWEAAAPIMAEFVERTKTETGCLYYGWSRLDDKLFCREAYVDAAAVLAHLENVGFLVGKLLESCSSNALDGIELHGPSAELEKCKSTMDGFGTAYWEIDSGVSFISKEVGSVRAEQTLMTIQPTFTIKDWKAAEPIMAEFVKRTRTETGCVYYGWTKVGDKLFCREAYVDAAGVLAHLENVGELVGKLLESCSSNALDKIALHGPSAELDKCKSTMDGFGTTYWAIDSGFQNYAI